MAFNIQEIRSDIASAINKNPEAFQAALSSQGIFLSKYAKRLTKIDGEYIKEKYKNIQGQEFGEKLHQERVRWMKMQHRIK